MCGRFTYLYTWREIHDQLSLFGIALAKSATEMAGPKGSYNVAPTMQVPVLRPGDGGLEPDMMRWGLIPHWSKDGTTKYATFNARAEDAATKPTFRSPFRHRRCIVPASGFYEWKKLEDGSKQPFYIVRADGEPIYFAGLWDRWHDELDSCTILTTTPNAEMAELHNRMPCILEPEQIEAWVDAGVSDPDAVQSLLAPAADGVLEPRPVSKRVGSVRNNDPGLIESIE